ncbi:MAG TPA: site-specific integrase [Pirellulaceae bacterium]|nr:site-specific integrase [Pirellulaceae bacterium]
MPRLTQSVPKYRKHKASGQAIVTLDGQDFYLGPYDSRPSWREYDRLVGEWQQNGRRLPQVGQHSTLTMAELMNAYRMFAAGYYVKHGQPTDTIYGIRAMLKLVRASYTHTRVLDFGPLALKALQSQMIESGSSRRYINDHLHRIRRMFKWAAGNEMIPYEVYQRLTTVDGLRKGRTEARETAPIPPIADSVVEQTLPHLTAVVADMVRFQRLTGCRPGEVCILRPCDLDTSGDVWTYRPESHKTEHHDRDRIIVIGPKAQDILRPYLLRDAQACCFCPADSELKRRREAHEQRVTPLKYGNSPGTNRKRKPKRSAGDSYTNDSYRRAIHRGCDKAFPAPEPLARRDKESVRAWRARLTPNQRVELDDWQSRHRWSPNQLRHTAATEIRRQFGLEAAQVTLGHSNANVTQIYAERDLSKAAEIMRAVG